MRGVGLYRRRYKLLMLHSPVFSNTILGMSVIAGLLLMFFGAVSGYLGYIEIVSPKLLTTFAAYVTTAVGALLFLAGLAHFKAPHKAFLITIPLLIYFHLQMYFNAIFYFARPLWPQQLSLLLISALILGLSYYGYRKSKTSSAV